jgi:ribosomal protein S18 acetylase RimI-like enzyme
MIEIRGAHAEDAAGIAHVHVESWRATYAGLVPDKVLIGMNEPGKTQNWARLLAVPLERRGVRVAYATGLGIVGFGSCGPCRKTKLPSLQSYRGEVYTLYVHPDYQDQGIGRRLLAELFDDLRQRSLQPALIWVLASNPSRFFYEAMGGARVAERDEPLWGTTLRETAYGWTDLARLVGRRDWRSDSV